MDIDATSTHGIVNYQQGGWGILGVSGGNTCFIQPTNNPDSTVEASAIVYDSKGQFYAVLSIPDSAATNATRHDEVFLFAANGDQLDQQIVADTGRVAGATGCGGGGCFAVIEDQNLILQISSPHGYDRVPLHTDDLNDGIQISAARTGPLFGLSGSKLYRVKLN